MTPGDFLFVYGTLRRGTSNDLANKNATFLQPDRINGLIYNLGWYPGLKTSLLNRPPFEEGLPSVVGDVFRLNDEAVIRTLDGYEGYPSLYDRSVVRTASGLYTWVYTYNHPVSEDSLVPDGDWMNHIHPKTTD